MLIGFSGTQCSGKSTLLQHLKDKNPDWNIIMGEDGVVRKLKKEYGITINQNGGFDTQLLITAQHVANIYKSSKLNTMVDRCVFDSFAYALHTGCFFSSLEIKKAYELTRDVFEMNYKKYDKIFLMNPDDVTLEEDGVRSNDPEYRKQIHDCFQLILDHYKMDNVIVVSGTVQERLEQIKEKIDVEI